MSDAAVERPRRSRPDACSVIWDIAGVSALGTAPTATFWVALEQNGPWGAQAAVQSHLDPRLGQSLDRRCKDAGGRLILIRRPGSHADLHEHSARKVDAQRVDTRRVYLAGGLASRPWLLEADVNDPAGLTRLGQPEMQALARGDIDAVQGALPGAARSAGPVLLICTNSKRDVCCSARGREVAFQAASQRSGQVWECSHTGGHRFAPTGVLLPAGQTFGRLSGASAVAVIDAAAVGELPTALLGEVNDRGRSHLPAAGQAAESMVRQQIQEASLLALSTTASRRADREDAWQCRVSHVDGRHWDVEAVRSRRGEDLAASCGKDPVPVWQWSLVSDLG
ncbi:MAG: sucrase ferredoxin [Actinomycetota bacterium]